ncbi:hypothetical protein D9619_010143 [Psilocybe cf. subviscida]|uniref:Hydrophobin n=1 Tax=Psilocybe cf. subviscida TaxID=2480587 RepID=A0A8H5ERT2_9AGAR|nr:hypothetical protein D9619_010143 [Psilocybe cf. subviscida]
MNLFAFSFHGILATLFFGTTIVAVSTGADVQCDMTDIRRLADSFHSKLVVYKRIKKPDAVQGTLQACLNLTSGLETFTLDAKNLVPQHVSANDTISACNTLEKCPFEQIFKSLIDLAVFFVTIALSLPATL